MIPFLALAILVLIALAFVHFIYESLMAPTIRTEFRFELYRLRDRLRCLRFDNRLDLDHRVYRDLEEALNTSIRYIDRIDLPLLVAVARGIRMDADLEQRLRERVALLEQCPLEEVKKISRRHYEIVRNVAVVNSLMGILLLMAPAALLISGLHTLGQIGATLKTLAWVSPKEIGPYVCHEQTMVT